MGPQPQKTAHLPRPREAGPPPPGEPLAPRRKWGDSALRKTPESPRVFSGRSQDPASKLRQRGGKSSGSLRPIPSPTEGTVALTAELQQEDPMTLVPLLPTLLIEGPQGDRGDQN